MPRLQEIQATWNSLVPQAQQLGIARVRLWNQIPASIREGQDRLDWLIAQISARDADRLAMESQQKADLVFDSIIERCDADGTDSVGVCYHLMITLARYLAENHWTPAELKRDVEHHAKEARDNWLRGAKS